MDQPKKTLASEGADARKWVGRIIVAVILGEAIWNLIVSVMNNLVVPWLGDVMGPSSGLPTSFTQRPYNYPDLFVSILESSIAGLVAAILNYFFQRSTVVRVKPVKSGEPARVVVQAGVAPPQPQTVMPMAPTVRRPEPLVPASPVIAAPAMAPPPAVPAVVTKPSPVAPLPPPVAASVARPQPPPPKAEPAKPKKPKEVYYNIVGEPLPSDEE